MERPNAIAAMRDKRGEIAGRIDALQDQLRQVLIDLDHVDSTILLFVPYAGVDEIKAKPMPPQHHAFKGQVTRAILDVLRKSGAAMDGLSITRQLPWMSEMAAIFIRTAWPAKPSGCAR